MDVFIERKTITALVDIGAMRSLINVLLAQQLELEIKPSSLHLKGANGQPPIDLEATASIVADGQAFGRTFIVVPHLESERLLLWNDLLVISQAIIDWGANAFRCLSLSDF